MKLPTIKQLRYFVALTEVGHFSRAAESCFVSQSAFSNAIQELESLLNAQLVDRTNRSVTITAMGQQVATQARLCLRDMESLVEIASGYRQPLTGDLHLGVIPTIAPFMLPGALPKLRRKFPELRLYLHEEQSQRIYERLMDGEPFEYHWGNRAGSHDVTGTAYRQEYEQGARRFDVGEHTNYITLPMITEGIRQATAWGGGAIQDYCAALGRPLVDLLEDERFLVAPASERIAHIIGIRLADATRLSGVMQALADRQVRVSKRGQSIRVSPHVYNTPENIDALMDGLVAGLG